MRAYLSLGTNIGDRGYYLQESRNKLSAHKDIVVVKISSIYETKPWGVLDQADFWNQVLEIETNLAPLDLLDVCQQIEANLGRERLVRWGPRTIDIDILFYDHLVCNEERLTLPHPRIEEREFVLAPWREICPDFILPSGRAIAEVAGEGEIRIVNEIVD